MYISKSRFINWTRCPMYFPMDLKHNPTGKADIDEERERRAEMLEEIRDGISSSGALGEEEEEFDASPSPELEALLPYYNKVEDEALKVARKHFGGTFIADSGDVHNQKLFEYEHNGHIYRCYVDIYNETPDEINIIEVKATTNSKYRHRLDKNGKDTGLFFSDGTRGGSKFDLLVKDGNIWHFNVADSMVCDGAAKSFEEKKKSLLDRFSDVGKYPHDLAFQRFVIEHALRNSGDKRPVNFYLAVLNSEYVYDDARDADGNCIYNENDGQEIITFLDLNEVTEAYQPIVLREIATLESYISTPHDVSKKVPVGCFCAWGKNTECVFWKHCFRNLRNVPDYNSANKYLYSHKSFMDKGIVGKYELIEAGKYSLLDVEEDWLKTENHKIQRKCCDTGKEYVDKDKMQYWFNQLEYPIYHFDFESFPCPLPRFRGETPYRQSVFEFSLHIERGPGVCDKSKDNYIFLNENSDDDERKELAKAIIDHFKFNEDGTLHGTMLAQNTSFERGRLEELAVLYTEYANKLRAIRDKSADLIDLLKTKEDFYKDAFGEVRAKTINYYHPDLSGSYSIKKTLPVLVPALTYKNMEVGNGSQAYIAYINYDSKTPTVFDPSHPMYTKAARRAALKRYCQQDTWAMVEILRAVREKI